MKWMGGWTRRQLEDEMDADDYLFILELITEEHNAAAGGGPKPPGDEDVEM